MLGPTVHSASILGFLYKKDEEFSKYSISKCSKSELEDKKTLCSPNKFIEEVDSVVSWVVCVAG